MRTLSKQGRKVMWITVSAFVFLVILDIGRAYAQITQCQDQDGTILQIPEGMKPVLIPAWLDPERIIIQTHVARSLGTPEPETVHRGCDPDQLAVSPSVCDEGD